MIFTIHTAHVDGTITLQGAADLLPHNPDGTFNPDAGFTVIDHAVTGLFN